MKNKKSDEGIWIARVTGFVLGLMVFTPPLTGMYFIIDMFLK